MSDRDRWRKVDAIVERALEAPADQRATIVSEACEGDLELEREVLSLLQADERAGRFLETPAVESLTGDLAPAEPPVLLAVGQVLADRYRIDGHVGNGGMGAVYRARDLLLDTDVAVKALEPNVLSRPGRMEALRQEVRLARLVTHANVCRVHDLVEHADACFITMEFVRGESLAARLERSGPLPAAECVRVLTDVARGLGAAHAAGVVHRDLKPANVLLRQDTGEAVVADFGIAADAADPGRDQTKHFGTRGYVAPEQRAGAPPDARSDLFSLGVLAHRMATGALPGEPGAAPLPRELEALVASCLREQANERPRDANEALRVLERAAGRRASVRRRTVRLALATALLAAIAFAWWWRSLPIAEDVVLAAVDTTALDPAESWIGDALRGLVVNDLVDAWGLEAHAAPSGASPPAAVRARVWRDSGGQLRGRVELPSGESSPEIRGGALRELAEASARWIAGRLVREADRHPTALEMREVGAHDPEAWRDFRRARRAARMQLWGHVRALAHRAIERDRDFPMAWLEIAFSYDQEDQAREKAFDRAIALAGSAQGLSPLSRLAIEYGHQSRLKDEAGVGRVLKQIGALPLEGQDLLYVRTRVAFALFARGEPENGLPLVEQIVERWRRDAAAPKRLADYYLGLDEPVSLALALRYGRQAVALAPEDVGARANLARALLLTGDEAAARDQLRVIDGADPDDKQAAFVTEQNNRLFTLHMALGEVEDAAADARRLLLEPGVRHAQGEVAQAAIALSRGAFDEGLAKLAVAAGEFEQLELIVLAVDAHWQRAWQSFSLGRYAEAREASGEVQRLEPGLRNSRVRKYALRATALGTLSRMLEGEASPSALDPVRPQLAELLTEGEWRRWRAYLGLLERYCSRDWRGVVAAYRELETSAVPLATTYYAATALERLGRPADAVPLYEQLAMNPSGWYQPYRRGQAWLRLGQLREEALDAPGAEAAYQSLLRSWDRAPRDMPEIREAQRRLRVLGARHP